MFDSPYNFYKKKEYYRFATKHGIIYELIFVYFAVRDEWEISFYEAEKPNELNITGTSNGQVIRIYATIIKLVREWIEETKPNKIAFAVNTKEEGFSRQKLYEKRLIKMIMLPEYTRRFEIIDGVYYYYIERNNYDS